MLMLTVTALKLGCWGVFLFVLFFFFQLNLEFFFPRKRPLITQPRTRGAEKPKQKSRDYSFDTDFRQ